MNTKENKNEELQAEINTPEVFNDKDIYVFQINGSEFYSFIGPKFEDDKIIVTSTFERKTVQGVACEVFYQSDIQDKIEFSINDGLFFKKASSSELEWLKKDLATASSEVLNKDINFLVAERETLNQTIEIQTKQIESLNNEIVTIKNEANDYISVLKEEIERLNKTIEEYKVSTQGRTTRNRFNI